MTAELPVALDLEPLVHRATGLLCRLGLNEGDRVLTLLLNSPDAFALGLACQLAGVVQVPLYPDLPPREVAEIVADAAPHAAIIGSDVPAHARHHLLVPPVIGDNPGSAPARRTISRSGLRPHLLDPGGLALERAVAPAASWPRTRPMAYTSGTTGLRKGVHVGVRDEAWGRQVVLDEYHAFEERHGGTHLVVSPLPHSGPFRFAFVTAFLGGRVAVLPRFDPDLLRETLRSVRPTSFFCVPTQLHRLMSLPATNRDDLASLTLLAHAGTRCPARLKERVLDLAPEGSVWEFYGSTEGQFSVCPPRVWQEAPGTVGLARPDRRLEIRDGHNPSASSGTDVPDIGRPAPRPSSRRSGRSLPAGKVGTVWVHAPEHASWHYWRDPRRTAEAWDGDAFTVGDLGRLDEEGRLFLEGRPGDLVISGGVNIYPAEVERWLLEYPAVAEAVVFGVPDDEWGERLVAAVIPRPGCHVTPEGLREHCREGLHRAKVPKQVFVVDDLPRTVTGKISRAGLAQALGLPAG